MKVKVNVVIDETDEMRLVVEGVKIYKGVFINLVTDGFDVTVTDDALSDKLLKYRASEFTPDIHKIFLYRPIRFIPGFKDISLSPAIYPSGERPLLTIGFFFNPENWKQPWSIKEYQIEFKKVFEQENLPGIVWDPLGSHIVTTLLSPETNIGLKYILQDTETPLGEEITKRTHVLLQLHKLTEKSLLAILRHGSVVMEFDFPEEVKLPCEQYLLYFGQFLRDLGVESETALTHEAGQVLFTVTPTDKEQALDKIRAALNVYLQLPSSPISDSANESIVIQRLESNILRLRSDLRLAAAELQAKNATIQAHELIISIQKGLLSGEIIIDSLKDLPPKLKDTEELFGGTVALKKYDGKFVEVDLPELYRKLKRLFEKKEDG
jgi:hypothetical protein